MFVVITYNNEKNAVYCKPATLSVY